VARRSSPPEPQHASLSIEQMKRGIERIGKRIQELNDFNISEVRERRDSSVMALGTSVESTLASIFGTGTVEYNRYIQSSHLDDGGVLSMFGEREPVHEIHDSLTRSFRDSIATLKAAAKFLAEELVEKKHEDALLVIAPSKKLHQNKVFLVHGHDEEVVQTVARYLEKLGLEAIILREKPDQGRTII
jgi:hypothetical protein